MAIEKCIECGRRVLSDAVECPGCGVTILRTRKTGLLTKFFIGLVVVFFLQTVYRNFIPKTSLSPTELRDYASKTKGKHKV